MKKILLSIVLTLVILASNVLPGTLEVSAFQNVNTDQLVNLGTSLVGTPYRYGGTTKKGFDCSGFIGYVFSTSAGKKLPRTAANMWKAGTTVNTPEIGDLVFFQTYKKGPSHVGIFIGNDSFVHASSSKGVRVSKLSEKYYKARYLGAKKI
ncbi:C40 family peptidase [Bacillus sp. DJP31]|uniref:C40 family peptidase n=1 Tax=Bacillus sp. DJP31 TaxID=3409789 RepID=UPI003BB63D55